MSDLSKFYQSILNIRQKDMYETIKNITIEERNLIYNYTNDLTGYCKYLANQISSRLNDETITNYWIDLKELVDVDHTILIAEYMHNYILKRILIDPTFSQFIKDEKHQLIGLKEWPSEKLDKEFLKTLLEYGIIEIDDNMFKKYLNSFSDTNYELSLNDFLLKQKLERKSKR